MEIHPENEMVPAHAEMEQHEDGSFEEPHYQPASGEHMVDNSSHSGHMLFSQQN
jgi:hypothetical protein